MFVKICGIRSQETAMMAVRAGADAIGFVFARSRRQVAPEKAEEIAAAVGSKVKKVGVFVNADPLEIGHIAARCGLDFVQLHGTEAPEVCNLLRRVLADYGLRVRLIKAVRVRDRSALRRARSYPADVILFDTYVSGSQGGTGRAFDWDHVVDHGLEVPVILAGGLNPRNVGAAVQRVRPWGVDVSSGVETNGEKDPDKMARFVQEVRRWQEWLSDSRS